MCGIVGWMQLAGGAEVDEGVLIRMRDKMSHRGPDGDGVWIRPARDVGFAFRRLAIVDLSAEANQPMANEDGSVHVVFNGEIYNHQTLRTELASRGHRFKTDHSDTEAIVHGYEEWGLDVVRRLDGMFAIAIWDDLQRRLVIFRDRVGIKPLYFTRIPGALLFASEIKALVAHPRVECEMDPVAAYHYLSFLVPPAPMTMFRGIYKLPAGWLASVDPETGDLTPRQYWDALPAPETRELLGMDAEEAERTAASEIRARLDAAVAKRLMSDVPFGVLLSGGIDSSAITALVSRYSSAAVRTFTVGFSDHTELNELDQARAVSKYFATEHHEIRVDKAAMREYLPELVVTQDEPIADWVCVPLYFVSRLVRQTGTIVTLVGEGADEEFCGYRSFMGYLQLHDRYWRRWLRVPRALRLVSAAVAAGVGARRPELALYMDIPQRAAENHEMFWGGAIAFWESQKRFLTMRQLASEVPPEWLGGLLPAAFLEPDSHQVVRHHVAAFERACPGHDELARMTYLEFKQRLAELLLMRVDKITMSTSVEARVPFLDPILVTYTMGLPRTLKVPRGQRKHLLKTACRGLIPDAVIDAEKRGFGAPMAAWLREDFGREAESVILGSRLIKDAVLDPHRVGLLFARHRGGADTSVAIWTLYNLAAWHSRWLH